MKKVAVTFLLFCALFFPIQKIRAADSSKYRFNTSLGMHVLLGNSALVSGMQFGLAPFRGKDFFIGPEFNFSLFSLGSLFTPAIYAWYEFKLKDISKMSFSLGASSGLGFSERLASLSTTSLVIMGDLGILQEIDDLFSIRGILRSGFVDKYFAFMMHFSVGFRFP